MDAGIIWVLVTIFIQTVILVWFLSSKFTNIDRDIKEVNQKIKQNDTKTWKIEPILIQITDYLSSFSTYLKDGNFEKLPSKLMGFADKCWLYGANSPMMLTPKWDKFINDTWFLDSFMQNKTTYMSEIIEKLEDKSHRPDFFYFVEKYSLNFINEKYDEEHSLLSWLREYIFKNWLWDDKHIKQIFLNTLGIYVRNEVIKELWKWEDFMKIERSADLKEMNEEEEKKSS